jgi:hypothetical protein
VARKLLQPPGRGNRIMEPTAAITTDTSDPIGKICHLRRPIRDRAGRSRFTETPVVLREMQNLDRRMYLVKFADGATTFVFPDEIEMAS